MSEREAHNDTTQEPNRDPVTTLQPISLVWIDLARTAAALAVVCIHVSGRLVTNPRLFGSPDWWVAHLFNSASRWSVPVFVMISGALLLNDDRVETVSSFYRRRARRILIPLFFWSAFYLVYRLGWTPRLVSPAAIRILVTGTPYYHLWYLYMIVGLYLMVPFLRVFVRQAGPAVRYGAIALALAAAVLDTLITVALEGKGAPGIVWMSLPFLGYFLAGYEWRRPERQPSSLVRRQALIGSLVSLAVIVTSGYVGSVAFGTAAAQFYGYKFLSLPVLIFSMCVMGTICNVPLHPGTRTAGWLSRLSGLTLGIYLLHPFVLRELARMGVALEMAPALVSIPLVSLATFGVSAVITVMFKQLPGLRTTV